MGGKETSKRASAASRVSLTKGTHSRLAPLQDRSMERSSHSYQQRAAYLYAVGLVVAVALTVYVFALSY